MFTINHLPKAHKLKALASVSLTLPPNLAQPKSIKFMASPVFPQHCQESVALCFLYSYAQPPSAAKVRVRHIVRQDFCCHGMGLRDFFTTMIMVMMVFILLVGFLGN